MVNEEFVWSKRDEDEKNEQIILQFQLNLVMMFTNVVLLWLIASWSLHLDVSYFYITINLNFVYYQF